MEATMTLKELAVTKSAKIEAISGTKQLRRRIMDMGMTVGTIVTIIKTAPLGDPLQIRLRGYDVMIRKADAAMIEIKE
jgi:ferrous iron transport protein A